MLWSPGRWGKYFLALRKRIHNSNQRPTYLVANSLHLYIYVYRYDTERLASGLPRVRPLTIDDNPVLREGYFGKLFDTNSGQNWGTRQADTRLQVC